MDDRLTHTTTVVSYRLLKVIARASDVNKDLTFKAKDKDKDQTLEAKDQDKD